MRPTPLMLAAAFVASAMVVPVAADPPGNYSITFEYLVVSYFDFRDGVGVYDTADPGNTFSPCVDKLQGLRVIPPIAETWEVDQNMGTNLNGPGIGVSDLGIGGKPAGVDSGFTCKLPVDNPTNGRIYVAWPGMVWRSTEHDSSANLFLCTQKVFASSSPGCLAFPTNDMKLWVSACGDQNGADLDGNVASRTLLNPAGTGDQPDWATANFGGDYTDAKGKYVVGEPWDTLNWKSDVIKCPVRKTVNYTSTIQDFTAGGAGQTFDLIKNEAVVHYGHGTTYMAVCWEMDYLNFSNPLAPTLGTALAHDWKLIIDLNDPQNTDAPTQDTGVGISGSGLADALEVHYMGARVGDNSAGANTVALRGFYGDDSGDPKDGGSPDGQNGFGPCQTPNQAWDSPAKLKEPTPII